MDLKKTVERWYPEMVKFRRYLHENPELSSKEFSTSGQIRNILEQHGINIEPIGTETGVCAFIPGIEGSKTVVLREDIDALPIQENTGLPFSSCLSGVSHACGHDIHTACLMLTGIVLNELKEQLKCNVRVVFQPAEETFTGAAYILNSIRKLRPKGDAVIGLHTAPSYPVGSIAITKGAAEASCDIVEITVTGKGGHGAYPQKTIDPIVSAAYMIGQMQTVISRENDPFSPAVLSFGSVHGGSAPNIVPEAVKIVGTLRTFSEECRKNIIQSIKRIAEYSCKSMLTEASIHFTGSVPVVYNNEGIVDKIVCCAKEEIGKENVIEKRPSLGSDDFSVYLQDMPGAQFFLGTANEHLNSKISLHSPNIIFDERSICVGALVMSRFALEF